MGFINQSLAQLRDLFASMTPAARITSALLLGVIVVSLGYLFQGYSAGAEELLFGGEVLQPRETQQVEAAIAKAGLTVLPLQSGRIVVPRGQKAAYLAAVADAGALPANFDTLLDESLNGGLLESSAKGKQRFKAARERQLSMLVSEMDGIDDAKVMYDIREPTGFEKPKATATVSLRPESGVTLDPVRMKHIRQAIAGAIAGLDAGAVTILDLSSGSEYAGGADLSAESFDNIYWQTRTKYEQLMKARIEDLLRYIPGLRVQVSAVLDPTIGAERRVIKADGELAAVRESTTEQTITSTKVEDRGRPGAVANGPQGPPPEEAVAKNEHSTSNNNRETENFVPKTEEVLQQAGLAPQHVTATIAVPSDYLARVWREKNPDADPATAPDAQSLENIKTTISSDIQELVTKLLPREPAENPYPNVAVTVFQSLKPDAVEPPSMVSEGLLWAKSNSGSLMMGGLAVVSLVMLRSMVKSIPAPDPNLAFAAPALAAGTARDAEQAAPASAGSEPRGASKEKSRPRLRLKKGPTLKDDLTEMVREDPDGAAAILRNWIGNAG